MNGRPLDVHIRKLVLKGMPPGGERRLRDAIQRQVAMQMQGTAGKRSGTATDPEAHIAHTVANTVQKHAERKS